jgi:hypothetical protein
MNEFITVEKLQPGDVVIHSSLTDERGCYIQQAIHPVWPHLRLVIWRMEDGAIYLDALDSRQVVGVVVEKVDVRGALLGDGRAWVRHAER